MACVGYSRVQLKTLSSLLKWRLMQCQILLVIYNWVQGNWEGEYGNLSEVTSGFSPGTPAIGIHIFNEDVTAKKYTRQIIHF